MLSLKVALLLTLAMAKRVSDIHALSVHPVCMCFTPGKLRLSLKPKLAYVPKVVGPCLPVDLAALQLLLLCSRARATCVVSNLCSVSVCRKDKGLLEGK